MIMLLHITRFTRSLIKFAVTLHRQALTRVAIAAENNYQTSSYIADLAHEHATQAEAKAVADLKHSITVATAVDDELATLPEYK